MNELAAGYPGYNGSIPFENGFLSEMLLAHGYSTYMVGKYHLLPSEFESGAGPLDRWPLGRGFERFYGFYGGDTSQWTPELTYRNHQVARRAPEQGYRLTEDLVDKAVEFIADAKQVAPQQAVLPTACTGAMHTPHHVGGGTLPGSSTTAGTPTGNGCARSKEFGVMPPEVELSGTDPVPDWDSLQVGAQAGGADDGGVCRVLVRTDHPHRPVARLPEGDRRVADNTLIMVVIQADGPQREGGPARAHERAAVLQQRAESLEESLAKIDELATRRRSTTTRGAGPGRETPRSAGGSGSPAARQPVPGALAVRISARGEVRTQYGHIIDMVPTILDAFSLDPPATRQAPSRRSTGSASPTRRPGRPDPAPATLRDARPPRHRPRRMARSVPVAWPLVREAGKPFGMPITAQTLTDLDARHWELYHVAEEPHREP